jgi:hypothetical protein
MFFVSVRKQLFRVSRTGFTVAALAFIAPLALHATTITLDLTFTDTTPGGAVANGIGTVTLDITGPIVAQVDYTPTALSLSFDNGAATFNMNDPGASIPVFQFQDTTTLAVRDITFAETDAAGYRITSTSGYTFTTPTVDRTSGTTYSGTITSKVDTGITSSVASTPEPGSITLLGTGLLACVGSLRRRIRRN